MGSSEDLIVPAKFPILSYTSVGKEKFHLMEMHKRWFPDMEANFLLSKRFSSLEYLSNILTNQYVDMSRYKHELEKQSDITGEALEWEDKQRMVDNYRKVTGMEQNIARLIQTLNTCRKDFDPRIISQLQQSEYALEWKKATQGSRKYVIIDDLLYKGSQERRLVLQKTACLPLFIKLHQENLHSMEENLMQEIKKVFYITDKSLKSAIKTARESCPVCSFLVPSPIKTYVGNKRTIKDCLPGNTWFGDTMYVTIQNKRYYVLLLVDLTTKYALGHLVKEVTAAQAKDFIRLVLQILPNPDIVATDSGPEFSSSFSNMLKSLNVNHRILDALSSSQNLAESANACFRKIFSKVVHNYLRSSLNPNRIPFEALQNVVQLAFKILKESRPKGSAYSRASLFWGGLRHWPRSNAFHLFSEEREESEKEGNSVDLDLASAAKYEDFLSLWDSKQAATAKRAAQLNKSASKLYLKRGDLVFDKKSLHSNKRYTTNQKEYFSVLFVKSPTCPRCIGELNPCHLCREKPTTSVKLLNLNTGRVTSRQIQQAIPIPSGELLDPQFIMNLPQLKAFNRHHHSDLGHYYQDEDTDHEETEQNRYNLRSQSMVGDFSLLEDETGPTFKGQPISVKVIEGFEPTKVTNSRSILKSNKNNMNHSVMMENLLQNISGDQLPATMAGMQFHLDLSAGGDGVSLHKYQY